MKKFHLVLATVSGLALVSASALAQDRIKEMPGYDQYQKMRPLIQGLGGGAGGGRRGGGGGGGGITWLDEGQSFDFSKGGQRYHYDIASGKTTETDTNTPTGRRTGRAGGGAAGGGRRGGRGGDGPAPERGRQYTSANSPDGKFKASYRDRNLYLSAVDPADANEFAVTTDGNEKARIKYGTASWVYGEELGQRTAMWWSPDSKKIAFYRFDESGVQDYYLQLNQRDLYSRMDVEPYTKVGTSNPIVDILIYDLDSKKTTKVDVRDGKSFDNSVVGHYVYNVSWSKDSRDLIFHRANRRQNVMELTAADPNTGKCRVIVHEEWPTGWVEDSPAMQFLEDGKRFIWTSERNGWKNLYLYNLDGKLLATLTHHDTFEAANVERVDEKAGLLYYMAHDGDNPMKLQLHRVGLDGRNDVRLTDPKWQHSVDIAPDGKHFVDTVQTHDTPPSMHLVDGEGKVLTELTKPDLSRYQEIGIKPVELLTFKAADGVTDLYGLLSFPSQFDPSKKYPLLVSVYGGPNTVGARETFATPNPLTEFGFLVATFDSRSASGRGKKFIDSIYLKLGITEMDDQAAGVKALYNRPYLDKNRVGIFGTSYGGTSAATCLLRFPDVFQAASSSSPVTDYRNYDTIYAERYMWIPQENKEGFDNAAIMTYAKNLKGRLLLYYGTADNNVHPNNSMQLITALQRAGKSFEVQVGPDQGHGSVNQDRMMEFFIENLVLHPAAP